MLQIVRRHFDFRPRAIIDALDLKRPIYARTAAHGHFGRLDPEFTWERTDRVADLRRRIERGGAREEIEALEDETDFLITDIGERIANTAALPYAQAHWVLEGGAIDHDGSGTVITTEQCLLNPNRNPGATHEDIEGRLEHDLGFERGAAHRILDPYGVPPEAWMVHLLPAYTPEARGLVTYAEAFALVE